MSQQDEYKRLRSFMNPAVRGKNIDAILEAIGTATKHLTDNVRAVHDQIFIASASGRYLDQRLADYNLERPAKVGLDDEVFREIGISVVNRKQVRDLLNEILLAVFGDESTNATSNSGFVEPYNLDDGDTLLIDYDKVGPVTITFTEDQFTNINTATAQEVADAITRSLRKQGKKGRAFAKDDGAGPKVILISDTIGPSSSVTVAGGRAQNVLIFDKARPTTGGASTQWTLSQVAGGSIRFTWTGGASPSVGKVRIGDYANVYGTSFDEANRGTYVITNAKGGTVNSAFFEVDNPNGIAEIVVQGTIDSLLFFQPFKNTIISRKRYAAIYQSQSRLLEIILPATTKVVRRERIGSAHLHGEAIVVTETSDPGLNEIFDVTCPAFAAISDGQYFVFDVPGTAYYLYYDKTGGNFVDPAPGGRTGIRVDISALTTATQVAEATATALVGTGDMGVVAPSSATLRAACLEVGTVNDAANVNVSGMTVSVYQQGVDASSSTVSVPDPLEGLPDTEGPYIYDPSQPFTVSSVGTLSSTDLSPDSGRIVPVINASKFPDKERFIILGYGTSHQEGPIPYLARPNSLSLLLNPSYRIKKRHPAGTDVALVSENGPVRLSKDGTDFQFYLTDVVAGREYVEDLINAVSATGINVVITIVYPGTQGLGKWNTAFDEKVYIWGP